MNRIRTIVLLAAFACLTMMQVEAKPRKEKSNTTVPPQETPWKANIYLSCDAFTFNTHYTQLKNEIQSELTRMGGKFVYDATSADWEVYVTATSREASQTTFGNMTTYFGYVDAKIVIEKAIPKTRVYDGTMSQKGGHTFGYEEAAQQAYKDITPQIVALIKEQITQK